MLRFIHRVSALRSLFIPIQNPTRPMGLVKAGRQLVLVALRSLFIPSVGEGGPAASVNGPALPFYPFPISSSCPMGDGEAGRRLVVVVVVQRGALRCQQGG
jgi:hypothetical protein